MSGVFVNYRTGDGEWAALLIHDGLSAQLGADLVFYASRSIQPGDDFDREIKQRLCHTDVLLAVIGGRWLDTDGSGRRRLDSPDDWVRQEIRIALEHNVRVIPVLLGEIPMVKEGDLPADIAALAGKQYRRVHYRDQHDITALAAEMRQILGVAEPVRGNPGQLDGTAQVVLAGPDQDHFIRSFVEWLNRRDTGDCIMIIVGPQIAAMRMTVAQSSRDRQAMAADPPDGAVPESIPVPVPGSVDVAVDASGRTVDEVWRRILDHAGIPRDEQVGAAEQIRAGVPPMTIVVDGVDHAEQPAALLDEVVKPLAERGSRLALGFWKDDSPSLEIARSWDLGSVGNRLERLAGRLGALENAERQLAWMRLEILHPVPVPGEAAVLGTPLAVLRSRTDDPDQESLRRDLDRLEQKVARALRLTTRAVRQLAEGLDERRILRRRLEAVKARAIQAGQAEDAGLDALYRQAHAPLWRKPVDLPAAQQAVLAYERELRRRRRGGAGEG